MGNKYSAQLPLVFSILYFTFFATMNSANGSIVTYLSPKEVLVNQPTILKGTFDPKQVATVSVVAEDKFPLTVSLDRSNNWQVNLDKGFTTAGLRWIRLQGMDKSGKVISDRQVYITVSSKEMNTAESLTLKIINPTFFKVSPSDSSQLNNNQKIRVEAGSIFPVKRYDLEQGHLKIELKSSIGIMGDFGYFYAKDVQLSLGSQQLFFDINDLPAPPPGFSQLLIRENTPITINPDNSSQIVDNTASVNLVPGQNFLITGYAYINDRLRVTLNEDISGFGKIGYVYAPQVQVKKDGKLLNFDSNSVTLTILRNTTFKKQPVDVANLSDAEKTNLPAGMIYGVSGYSFEESNLKVSLTENIPKFGNTGYLSPDFVQLNQGSQPFNITPVLTYRGPREVIVKKPTLLNGSYDPNKVANVALIAEDKYPLSVTLNKIAGTWQVNLNQGFQTVGSRWLRLRGTNSDGKVVSSQVINITVTANANAIGQNFTLKILKDTFFKVLAVDSDRLNQRQKVMVKLGQTFTVTNYGLVDGHLKVNLTSSIAPVGNFGYFYEEHIQLSKGDKPLIFDIEDVPNSNISAQMLVTTNTRIKAKPVDASELAQNQKSDLLQGQVLAITGYACTQGHFRVTLAQSIPGFGNVGFVYWQHVKIKKDADIIPFDPDALTATIIQATVFKRRAVDSSQLSANDKVNLPLGRVYGVSSYGLEDNHIKVALTEQLPPIGNTGYVVPAHVQMRRGGRVFEAYPRQVELNVPYFSQRDNPRFYWSTCNVTSIAMVFYYYGVRSQSGGQLEDELLQWCLNKYGEGSQTDHTVLSELIRAYRFKTSFSNTRRWAEIDNELINRRPVVLAGDFTATGHIVCVIGFNPSGLIINDPWGDALTGYSDTEGRKLLYPNAYLNQVCGPEGNVWAHFISP